MKKSIAVVVFLTVNIIVAQAFAQSGNAARGERTFNQQCKACHTVEKGEPSPLGPNLFGVIGRKAGTAPGYEFSDAMKKSGITWDDASLGDYLTPRPRYRTAR